MCVLSQYAPFDEIALVNFNWRAFREFYELCAVLADSDRPVCRGYKIPSVGVAKVVRRDFSIILAPGVESVFELRVKMRKKAHTYMCVFVMYRR